MQSISVENCTFFCQQHMSVCQAELVHDLVPTLFELAASPFLHSFFLQILMVQQLYFFLQRVSSIRKCPLGLETACSDGKTTGALICDIILSGIS